MYKQNIYLKDGTLFAKEFNRVVHGGRGDYVEFEQNQILLPLLSKFGNDINNDNLDIYYWWLFPKEHPNVKVYLQRKTVKYADYKIGKYYVSPDLFNVFKDPDMRTNLIKSKVKEEVKPTISSSDNGMLDMVIAFDTTGSMSEYINKVKQYAKELIHSLFKSNPNLRMGIVAFGDYYDMISKDEFGKAYQVCNLTDDVNKLIEFITNAQETSGGDWSEFYELVIRKIVEETNWRKDSTKAVLLIADADPHYVGYSYYDRVTNNQIDWREEAKKASEKGIKFDTLTISDVGWYEELSEITNGISVPFSISSKTTQLVEAATLARGGESARKIYYANMDASKDDPEVSAIYAAYLKEVIS